MPDDKLSTTETKRNAIDDIRSILALWLLDRAIDVAPEREKRAVALGALVAAKGMLAADK